LNINFIDFRVFGDERGGLISLEEHKNIPFSIKRVYYLIETKPDVRRGFHAHLALNQVAITISGSCKFYLDDGLDKKEVLLDSPSKGLIIKPMVWHEMFEFSKDCILMILADQHYDESDYVRNYNNFLNLVKLNK
jgi:dTDP-4-dehydrorhamnose 3,5-epimerase-like enzyme